MFSHNKFTSCTFTQHEEDAKTRINERLCSFYLKRGDFTVVGVDEWFQAVSNRVSGMVNIIQVAAKA